MSYSCEVCNNKVLKHLFEKDGYQYERCENCGLIRIFPQPSDVALEAIYQNDYYGAWGKSEDVFRSLKRKTFASILNMIPEESRGGRLLDVGAATGILMELARELNYAPYGVEVSREGASAISQKFGAERVFSGYLEQIDFTETDMLGTFNVVSMIDLLEHVRDPNEALRKAYSLLKPKGFLLLCLPDASSLTARVLGKRWNYYIPEHLFHFSYDCMSQILIKHGFKVVKQKAAPKYMTLDYIYSMNSAHPNGFDFLRSLLALVPFSLKQITFPLYIGQMKILALKDTR